MEDEKKIPLSTRLILLGLAITVGIGPFAISKCFDTKKPSPLELTCEDLTDIRIYNPNTTYCLKCDEYENPILNQCDY